MAHRSAPVRRPVDQETLPGPEQFWRRDLSPRPSGYESVRPILPLQGIRAISYVAQAVRLLTALRRLALFRILSRTTRGPDQVAHIAGYGRGHP